VKVIGLTGGIASGKSTVAAMFAELGARVASADADARAVVEPGSPTLAAVFAAFPGARRDDGTLDRAALGARIFADPEARRTLESITHPAIFERMQTEVARARAEDGAGLLVYEVPLLYEKNREGMFDAVVAVLALTEAQAERLQEREARAGRPPLSADAVAERLAAQMPPAEKARRADYVVRTDVGLEETRAQVQAVWEAVTGAGTA
jgi:dephospho-CoA kinase